MIVECLEGLEHVREGVVIGELPVPHLTTDFLTVSEIAHIREWSKTVIPSAVEFNSMNIEDASEISEVTEVEEPTQSEVIESMESAEIDLFKDLEPDTIDIFNSLDEDFDNLFPEDDDLFPEDDDDGPLMSMEEFADDNLVINPVSEPDVIVQPAEVLSNSDVEQNSQASFEEIVLSGIEIPIYYNGEKIGTSKVNLDAIRNLSRFIFREWKVVTSEGTVELSRTNLLQYILMLS